MARQHRDGHGTVVLDAQHGRALAMGGGGRVCARGQTLISSYLIQTRGNGWCGDKNNKRSELGGSQDLQRLREKDPRLRGWKLQLSHEPDP